MQSCNIMIEDPGVIPKKIQYIDRTSDLKISRGALKSTRNITAYHILVTILLFKNWFCIDLVYTLYIEVRLRDKGLHYLFKKKGGKALLLPCECRN